MFLAKRQGEVTFILHEMKNKKGDLIIKVTTRIMTTGKHGNVKIVLPIENHRPCELQDSPKYSQVLETIKTSISYNLVHIHLRVIQ